MGGEEVEEEDDDESLGAGIRDEAWRGVEVVARRELICCSFAMFDDNMVSLRTGWKSRSCSVTCVDSAMPTVMPKSQ